MSSAAPPGAAVPPDRSGVSELDSGGRIEPLWQASDGTPGRVRGGELPAELGRRYRAKLSFALRSDRPTIAANFVSTLDGVVALDRSGATGGREISGAFEPDRFVMGLLRATADAVMVGAGTFRSSNHHAWTPERVHPASAAAFSAWRRELGLSARGPATVVVTASGGLDPSHLGDAGVGGPVIVVTAPEGAARLRAARLPDQVEVVSVGAGSRVGMDGLVQVLGERGFELVVSEAGPTLFGQLLAANAVDELFLTVAPQLAGRSETVERLALVEGIGFPPVEAPWARLLGVMRSTNHLFLRYDLRTSDKGADR